MLYGKMPPKPNAIIVEYTSKGVRKQKAFNNPYQARSFYSTKLKEGREPKLVSPSKAVQDTPASDMG
jgi:hypothetical protein